MGKSDDGERSSTMKHKNHTQKTMTDRLMLVLLAIAMLLATTQCAAKPENDWSGPAMGDHPDASGDDVLHEGEADGGKQNDIPKEWVCDNTPYEELGLLGEIKCHEVMVSLKPEYNDKVYTPEDFSEVGCIGFASYKQANPPIRYKQRITLTLGEHSKQGVLDAIEILEKREDVAWAEPVHLHELDVAPNDEAAVTE
jgi:hypothetical protein